jgi:hypothetical protein
MLMLRDAITELKDIGEELGKESDYSAEGKRKQHMK